MNKKTLTALKASITRWKQIASGERTVRVITSKIVGYAMLACSLMVYLMYLTVISGSLYKALLILVLATLGAAWIAVAIALTIDYRLLKNLFR